MAAPQDLFYGSRLKIKRANQHIVELNLALTEFIKTNPYRLAVEKDPGTGDHVLQFTMTQPIPEGVPLMMGDALHNLRASLDFVASEIVRRANGPTRYVKFPFRDSRQELEAAVKGGEIKIAGQSVISAIVNEVKPYKGGNGPLWALNALDIADKHLLLVPVMSVVALTGVNLVCGSIVMQSCTLHVEQGAALRIVRGLPDGAELQYQGKPTLSVFFARGQPLEGEAIIPTLHQLSQLVSGSVDAIEKAYRAGVELVP